MRSPHDDSRNKADEATVADNATNGGETEMASEGTNLGP